MHKLRPEKLLKLFSIGLLVSLITTSATAGQFPYKAIVQVPSTEVKAQPNPNSVSTMVLPQGTEVTVQRHETGGMHRITPPQGSFSMVRADLVELAPNSNRGLIRQNKTRAYIGTSVDPQSPQTQFAIPLSKNDEVIVLDQMVMNTPNGEVQMYLIAPPSYTYSWVSGRDLVPASQYQPQSAQGGSGLVNVGYEDNNPFGRKELVVGQAAQKKAPPTKKKAKPKSTASKTAGVRETIVNPTQLRSDREALKKLDRQFKEMVQLDPHNWTLTELRSDYQQLQDNAVHKAFASQIDLRLAAVKRYEKIKTQYDSFIQLTSSTTATEEALRSQQETLANAGYTESSTGAETVISSQPETYDRSGFQSVGQVVNSGPEMPVAPGTPVVTTAPQTGPTIVNQGPVPIPEDQLQNSVVQQSPGPRLLTPDLADPQGPRLLGPTIPGQEFAPPAAPPVQAITKAPSFDGKGIIRRTVSRQSNMPAHVLVNEQGKIIAYLQPNGQLDLNQYVGQPMGIQGEVSYRSDLKRHVLMIDRMRPITLTR